MIHIVTVATHSERYLPVLEKMTETRGYKLQKLGFGKEYAGHFMKDKEMMVFLEKLPYDDIVIFLDGFDTLILSDINEVIEKFKKTGKKMIISTEKVTNSFLPHKYLYNKVNDEFINTGQYIGYCGYILTLLKKIYSSEYDKKSNQITWSNFLNKNKGIDLLKDFGTDDKSEIFFNYSDYSDLNFKIDKKTNRLILDNNSKPCFIQGNGMVNLNNLIKTLGHSEHNINSKKMLWKKIKFILYDSLKTYPIIKLYILWGAIVVFLIITFTYLHYKTRKFETFNLTFS